MEGLLTGPRIWPVPISRQSFINWSHRVALSSEWALCVCVWGVCVCVCLETRRVGFKFSFLCRGPERMGWGLWPMKTPPHPVQTYLQFFQTCQAKGPRTSKLSEMARGYQEPHSGDGARLSQELRFGNGKRLSQGPQFRSWQEAKPRTSTC